jgi:hypothetical protein
MTKRQQTHAMHNNEDGWPGHTALEPVTAVQSMTGGRHTKKERGSRRGAAPYHAVGNDDPQLPSGFERLVVHKHAARALAVAKCVCECMVMVVAVCVCGGGGGSHQDKPSV